MLKVEMTANDSPYLQTRNLPAEVEVTALSSTLPLHTADAEADPIPPPTPV